MAILAHLVQTVSNLPTDASALQSAISALEIKIKTLESSSVPWERSLPWFTGMVAFGVAMELWVIWRDRRDGMQAWGRGIIRPPDRPSIWRFVVEIVSVLFVTGGIVCELWAGVEITSINGTLRNKSAELRSKSDQLLALVTQEAGDAATSAKTAREEALLLGPREKLLVGERRQKLVDTLQPYCGQKIVVHRSTFLGAVNGVPSPSALSTSAEQDGLVKSLVSVLGDAHWKPETPVSSGFTKGFGMHVSVLNPSRATCKAATVLIRGLRKVPLEATDNSACNGSSAKTSSEEGTILLIVEPK